MSATELDLPVLISAEQIRRREFVTIRRGYDPDQVRDYLEKVADQVRQMEAMIREARLEAEAALRAKDEPRGDPYERLAARVASVLREADDHAARILRETKTEADRVVAEARADADRIRTDAQAKAGEARAAAEGALREAREHADRTIAGLATRRDALVEQLATMQERLLGVAHDLESAIEVRAEIEEPETRTIVLGEAAPEPYPETPPMPPIPAAGSTEELWEGTEAIQLQVPDIPPLDLSWGDEDDPQDETLDQG